MQIAFLGTGLMGSRMATHLLDHGHALTVYNRTRDKATALLDQGASWAATPTEAIAGADLVITMLAHPVAVEAVALGPDGFLDVLPAGTRWADCSTTNPSFARRMAAAARARSVRFVDAPVGGSTPQAEQAVLVFLVGGDADDVAFCKPVFELMGSKVVHVGETGMGISIKLVINLLLATTMAAFAESVALGEALGLKQEVLLNTLIGGPVAAPFLAMKRGAMESGQYDAAFPLRWMRKDVQMATQAAYEADTALPLGNAAKELYQLATQHGLGDADFSAIYAFLRGD